MADKRITDLPLIFSGDVTSTDVLPIVDVNLDITNKIEVDQLKAYILTGVNDFYVTGGTYSGGTLTLNRQNGSVTITGFTTGSTQLYEVGSGISSVQLVNVSGSAIGDYSVVSGGLLNTAGCNYDFIGGGYKNTTNSGYGRGFIGGGEFNTISSYYGCSVIVGGQNNRTYDGYRSVESNFIGGGFANTSSGYFSTVVAGRNNCSFGNCSFVGGGCGNRAYCRSTIAGGRRNSAGTSGSVNSVSINGTYDGTGVLQGTYSVYTNNIISSGTGLNLLVTFDSSGVITNTQVKNGGNLYEFGNQVVVKGNLFTGGSSTLNDVTYDITGTFTNSYASIIGGCGNTASGEYSTIAGGCNNTSSCYGSTVSGGYSNTSSGYSSTVSGGKNNKSNVNGSTIGGGESNITGLVGTISGIYNPTYLGSTASGYYGPFAPTSTSSGYGSGGQFSFNFSPAGTLSNVYINTVGENYVNGDTLTFDGTLFGGGSGTDDVTLNVNTTNLGQYSTISGGRSNIASGSESFIGGGKSNTSGNDSVVSGGRNNTSDKNSFIGGGSSNISIGKHSTVSGGRLNTASGFYSTVSGGIGNTSSCYYSTVSGGRGNAVDNQYDTIGGGGRNTTILSGAFVGAATISGGYNNTSGNYYTFNGGGCNNITLGEFSSIVGGQGNQNISGLVQQVSFNSGDASVIPDNTYSVYPTNNGGYGSGLQITFDVNTGVVSNVNVVSPGIRYEQGQQVLVSGDTIGGLSPANDLTFNLDSVSESNYSTISGGYFNTTEYEATTISGGYDNGAIALGATVGGGVFNTANNFLSTISGGYNNTTSGPVSFIGAGAFNEAQGIGSVVVGGQCNTASGCYSTIGGGGSSSGYSGHLALGCFSTVSGGYRNTSSGNFSTVSGGYNNTSNGNYSAVEGGSLNTSNGILSTVSGGYSNKGLGDCSFIGGGYCNIVDLTGDSLLGGVLNQITSSPVPLPMIPVPSDGHRTIGGGFANLALATFSVIGGGQQNTASGSYGSTVSGGQQNTASGTYGTTVSGGARNTSSGDYSTIGGGRNNVSSGVCSVANGGEENNAGGCHSFIGGGFQNVSGINGYVNGISGTVYTGGTFNSTFTGVIPTSTASGKGSNASFDFSFLGGVLQSVTIQFAGSGYVNGDTLYFNGNSFAGGSSPVDDVWITIQSTSDSFTTVVGGSQNTSSGYLSIVGAGYQNTSSGCYSFIGGGWSNTTVGDCSMILGGYGNKSIGTRSAVVGGQSIIATENDMVYMPNANIQSSGYIYFGDVNTNGSWRMRISGAAFIIEKRVGGVWVTSGTFV